jgi:hypothetical protein
MITIAICLIYYGIAVWLYQLHLWYSSGHWVSIPVMVAWREAFGVPAASHTTFGQLLAWMLDWPLSLALLMLGIGILSTIGGLRRLNSARRRVVRQKWIAEQCAQAGYQPWTVPKVLADLETNAVHGEAGERLRTGSRNGTEKYWR